MRAFVLGFILGVWPACAVWDYNAALQTCITSHVGDPSGREQCLCDVSKDAGRSCDWLSDDAGEGGAE